MWLTVHEVMKSIKKMKRRPPNSRTLKGQLYGHYYRWGPVSISEQFWALLLMCMKNTYLLQLSMHAFASMVLHL